MILGKIQKKTFTILLSLLTVVSAFLVLSRYSPVAYADAATCITACTAEGIPTFICEDVCDSSTCTYDSLDVYGLESNEPEYWCTYVQTNAEMCYDECMFDNANASSCSSGCNSGDSGTCGGIIGPTGGDTNCCGLLTFVQPPPPGDEEPPEITPDQATITYSDPGVKAIQGLVSDNIDVVNMEARYNPDTGWDTLCTLEEQLPGFYDFTCLTEALEAGNTYTFELSAEDDAFNVATETVTITIEGGSEVPTIVLTDKYQVFDTTGSKTITGTVSGTGTITDVEFQEYGEATWNSCSLTGGTDFTCTTAVLEDQTTTRYYIRAEDDLGNINTAPYTDARVEIDTSGGRELYAFWDFDDPLDPYTDVINGFSGTAQGSLTYTDDNYIETASGYLTIPDGSGNFSFSGNDTPFRVEASVYPTASPNYSRVVGKYNNDNNENTWVLGLGNADGVYSAVWNPNQSGMITGPDGDTLPLNQWSDIAFEWIPETYKLKTYIDGALVKEEPMASNPITSSTNSLAIGARATGGANFQGYVDNVRIYTGVEDEYDFDPPTISTTSNYAIYDSEGTKTISGTVTDDNNVESVEFKKASDSTWTECSVDSSNFTCTTETLSDETLTTFEIRATDDKSNTTTNYHEYQIEIDEPGEWELISYWNFDDSLDPYTDIINGHTAVNTLDVTHISNDYIEGHFSIDDSDENFSFDSPYSAFKVEARVYPTSYLNYRRIVGKYNEANNENTWVLGTDNQSGVYGGIWNTTQQAGDTGATDTLPLNSWSKIRMDYLPTDSELNLYIDDELITEVAIDNTNPISSSTNYLTIGARPNGSDDFPGYIDDVKIYYKNTYNGDGNPPKIEIDTLPDNGIVNTNSTTITGTIEDVDTPVYAEYLFIKQDYGFISDNIDTDYTWTEFQPSDGSWDETNEEFSISKTFDSDGVYWIYIRSRDTYGTSSLYNSTGWISNYATSTDYAMAHSRLTIEFEDNTPPEITLSEVNPNPTTKRNIYIKGFVKDYENDTQSSIASIEYQINDSGDWYNATIASSNTENTEKNFLISLLNLDIGTYTVEVRATDNAGNQTGNSEESCYSTCMLTGYQEEDLCTIQCRNSGYTDNKSITIEVEAEETSNSELVEETLSVSQTYNLDYLTSTSTIGQTYARLPINYTMNISNELFTDTDDFGDLYGERYKINVSQAVDGNLWLTFLNNDFAYYNIATENLTRYSGVLPVSYELSQITEIEHNNQRCLITQAHTLVGYTGVYCIGSTPENLSDDGVFQNYETVISASNANINNIQIDSRSGYPRITGALLRPPTYGAEDIINIDTKGTITDISDDTYTIWSSEISGDGIVGYLYDEDRDMYLTADYSTGVISVVDDNGTPNNTSDDIYINIPGQYTTKPKFQIKKDANDWYWFAGGEGIEAINIPDLEEVSTIPDDLTIIPILSRDDLGGEGTDKIYMINNTANDTQELLIITQVGTQYILDYNSSPEFFNDDKLSYSPAPHPIFSTFNRTSNIYDQTRDTVWLVAPNKGLYRIEIDREYKASASLLLEPNLNTGTVQVDHLTVTGIDGTYIGSIDIEVSNDGGLTWYPAEIGVPVSFPTSDSDIKVRLTLNRSSTPTVENVYLSYASYSENQFVDTDINIDYPEETIINYDFDVQVNYQDDLGYIPQKSGTVELEAYNAYNDQAVSGCFDYEIPSTIEEGIGDITAQALCTGTYYIVATTDEDVSVRGDNIAILANTPTNQITTYINDVTEALEEDEEEEPTLTNTIQKIVSPREKQPVKTTKELNIERIVDIAVPVTLLALSMPVLPYYILRIILGILSSLGLKKGDVKYGFVYDSTTKEPISQAIVRIFDMNGKIADTMVTGKYGELTGSLPSGTYTLKVQKPGYEFPSQIVTHSPDGNISKVYREQIQVTEQTPEILVGIPMDKIKKNILKTIPTYILDRGNILFKILRLITFILLFAYSIYAYNTSPNIINALILIAYFIIVAIVVFSFSIKENLYGKVKDSEGNTLENFKIQLIDTQFDTITAERITDEKGRYRFIVPPGKYVLRINGDKGNTIFDMEKEPSIINSDIIVTDDREY